MLQGEQIKKFKSLMYKDGDIYQYSKSISDIRCVALEKISSTDRDLRNYINYMNKNTARRSLNLNPNMMLPKDEAFIDYLGQFIKPHQDGSRLKKAA